MRREIDVGSGRLQRECDLGEIAVLETCADTVVLIKDKRSVVLSSHGEYPQLPRRFVVKACEIAGTGHRNHRACRRKQRNVLERRGDDDFTAAFMVLGGMKIVPTVPQVRQIHASLTLATLHYVRHQKARAKHEVIGV